MALSRVVLGRFSSHLPYGKSSILVDSDKTVANISEGVFQRRWLEETAYPLVAPCL